jgi:PASTA domain-containing protein
MGARFSMLAPRLIALIVIWLLGAASYTLAAGGGSSGTPTSTSAAEATAPDTLVVPEVRGQPYVFAKGMLEDAGFAWRVQGAVEGFAANKVVTQTPAPGTRVVDNGSPTVVLTLSRNSAYKERGLPENSSPFTGSAIVLMRDWRAAQEQEPPAQPTQTEPAQTVPTETTQTEPTQTDPAQTEPTQTQPEPSNPEPTKTRRPDFAVAGAPVEPADEMPLPRRARLVERRVNAASKPTRGLVRYWLYQHSWIVTGARFGWADGDEALRTLIRADQSLETHFGFGARSARVARNALAFVQSRKK